MTTSTASNLRRSAMDSLADLCGIDIRRGYSLPGDVFDAFLGAVSAATYPTLANIERAMDAADVLSARLQISVDTFADWRERWHDALIDHDHLAVSGLTVVEGELVRA
jgi:hypothetical protein